MIDFNDINNYLLSTDRVIPEKRFPYRLPNSEPNFKRLIMNELLKLDSIPTETLVSIKHAINKEIRKRKQDDFVSKRLKWLETLDFSDRTLPKNKRLLLRANEDLCLDFPGSNKKHYKHLFKYLPYLLRQDWSYLFEHANDLESYYYVYAHIDPNENPTSLSVFDCDLKGTPFYIGKGKGQRVWDLNRNQGHGKRIRQIIKDGYPKNSIPAIIKDCLTEKAALELEAKLIYFFASVYDKKRKGCLLNLADYIKPNFVGIMRKIPFQKQCKVA